MTEITEGGGVLQLGPGETILACSNPWLEKLNMRVQAYDTCAQCCEVPYRVVVIGSEFRPERGVALCGRHFIEACRKSGVVDSCTLPARVTSPVMDRNAQL